MPLREGARHAALRWLEVLRVADVPRARALFTHHPDYADLTPVQYADGLEWLIRTGLVDRRGLPVVSICGHHYPERAAAPPFARRKWDESAEAARKLTGSAGEAAMLELLTLGGAVRVVHVAAVSDTYGYDIEASSLAGAVAHLEVKATTDPTRLVVHLTRHEYEVMRRDVDWFMAAVLIDRQGRALNVVTVDRDWLRLAAPLDQDPRGAWETARYSVPVCAMEPGLVKGDGSRVIPADALPFMPVWGLSLLTPTRSV
ncbi:protein NO VEIN domain-containing protein [Streptomyces sp. NPDC002853]